ncbi:hypothetical protein RM844_31200 [Streptomyces sp. DSM 44915]|uniref:Uncharacterized protein n=1 Tax=Streptomyces chisholmiae TaxID=3075540 RepID=A0ABU2K0H2_9ACTN|nr:hypothetical protein [Streptomyces sp. DSM 44915]MDT0270747.1 hypothetical protein [Streptomyces sp. DSM 44915]
MTSAIAEISSHLPLSVESARQESEFLYLGGPNWRLRISGAWRLMRGTHILTSRDSEASGETSGAIGSLVGTCVVECRAQSAFHDIDIALVLDDGSVLETFSDYLYDTWLLTLGNLAIEGPLQR